MNRKKFSVGDYHAIITNGLGILAWLSFFAFDFLVSLIFVVTGIIFGVLAIKKGSKVFGGLGLIICLTLLLLVFWPVSRTPGVA